jgi:hypothetical protein
MSRKPPENKFSDVSSSIQILMLAVYQSLLFASANIHEMNQPQ